jgi:hypothetical protein
MIFYRLFIIASLRRIFVEKIGVINSECKHFHTYYNIDLQLKCRTCKTFALARVY